MYNTNYIPITQHIQHCLIFHKLRVIGGADSLAPTQPLSRVNEIYVEFLTGPGSGRCENLPHTHTHARYDRAQMYSYFFKGETNNIQASRNHYLHTHTCAANTKLPHSVHSMGSQQSSPSDRSKTKTENWT